MAVVKDLISIQLWMPEKIPTRAHLIPADLEGQIIHHFHCSPSKDKSQVSSSSLGLDFGFLTVHWDPKISSKHVQTNRQDVLSISTNVQNVSRILLPIMTMFSWAARVQYIRRRYQDATGPVDHEDIQGTRMYMCAIW